MDFIDMDIGHGNKLSITVGFNWESRPKVDYDIVFCHVEVDRERQWIFDFLAREYQDAIQDRVFEYVSERGGK